LGHRREDVLDGGVPLGTVLGVVQIGVVDPQQRRVVVVREEALIGPGEGLEVVRVEVLLELAGPAGDPLEQHLERRAEVDEDVGLEDLRLKGAIDALVEGELVVREGQLRKDPVFQEVVVRQDVRREEVGLDQLLLLLEAAHEEEELGLEGVAVAILVELGQKRVLLEGLEHDPRPQRVREPAHERRLADADGALDRDVEGLVHQRNAAS